ncbi:MAG: hypothetical protein PHI79_06790 [Sulfurovaceae bacterium]|nr:hypothetical protein [Sulfurovaceae bacterium]MDD5549282.1 hypothetical protein [Sulfurovaceae bacterium]
MTKKQLEKILGFATDDKEYKKFRCYKQYNKYMEPIKKIFPIGYKDFLKHIEQTIDKDKAQQFIDLMHKGYNVGNASKEVGLSFEESTVALNSCVVNCSHFGKTVKL